MDRRRDTGEWTLVSYRRGRNRRRRDGGPSYRDGGPSYRSPGDRYHRSGGRPSYASATRTRRGRDWDYPQRRYREPGFQPQFFDRRGYNAPPRTQYRNQNARKKYKANTRFAKQYTHAAPHMDKKKMDKKKKDDKPQSGDPDFGLKVRAMHKIIKLAHHLKNASEPQPPPTIRRLTTHLATIIKPAIPSSKTQTLIEGNAKNWECTTMFILRDHYTEVMESELDSLAQLSTHGWQEPFQVASSWAKRNLGRRLQNETLEQTQALIIAKLEDGYVVGSEREAHSPPPSPPPADTVTRAPQIPSQLITTAQVHVQPKSRAGTTVAGDPSQCPGPPAPPSSKSPDLAPLTPRGVQMVTVATTTDITGILPKPQRPPRTTTTRLTPPNPCIVKENDSLLDMSPQDLIDLSQEEPDVVPLTQLSNLRGSDVHSTPVRSHKLRTAVQSHLTLRPRVLPQASITPQPITRRPTKHIHTPRKMQDWSLSVNKKWLIIGDSNLARIPPFTCDDLQVDSYPGATFRHAEAIINKATISTDVEKVILAFGLNNRSQKEKMTAVRQLLAAVKAADTRFPHAAIWVPLVNCSKLLPGKERNNITHLNNQIKKNCLHIPQLPIGSFSTLSDHVHWTKATAKHMLNHWSTYVNYMAP